METIALRLEEQYPESNMGSRVNVATVYERNFGELEDTLLLLVYSVALVLLIACVNVASILLARGTSRQREIAIRSTVGASQGRIARLLLVEGVMLWLAGGMVGLVLSYAGTEILSGWLTGTIPRAEQIAVGGRALAFVLGVSFLTGTLFGLVPAWRSAKPDLVESLKAGLRTSGGRSRHRILKGLVVAEVTLAQVLLVVSGLTIHSLALLLRESPGVDVENLLTVRISLSESAYPELAQRHSFFNRLLERVEALPGVVTAAAGGPLPLHGGGWQSSYHVEGEPTPPPGQAPVVEVSVGTADYHRALGIPLLRGRYFTAEDRRDSLPVAIIGETFAERHWPGADPLGKRIDLSGRTWRVVGVVDHVKNRGVARESLEQIYLPFEWDDDDTWQLAVRTSADPLAIVDDVRSAVLEIDPNQPISEIGTMEDRLSDTTTANRMLTVLLGAFAAAALVLASVGIYGVMAYTAGERRHEIGIRMALGAIRGKVLGMVVRQSLGLALLGMALGLALSMGMGRLISSQLYGITPADPATLLAAPIFLGAVAVLASYLPARRASTVDPTVTLQNE